MKEKIKRSRRLLGLLVCLCLFYAKGREGRAAEPVDLEGQWKATEYVASLLMKPDYDHYQDFLGRSIIIEPNRIIRSLYWWPDKIEYAVDQYRCVEMETVKADAYGRRHKMDEAWFEKLGEQELRIITYDVPEIVSQTSHFYITEEGEILCEYLCGFFYMERYKEAETGVEIPRLMGEWRAQRLVSYQDGWQVNNAVVDSYDYSTNEAVGAFFNPEDYYGSRIKIGENKIELYQGEELFETYQVKEYESAILDKYDYQNEKGIHDELGIENEEIQVITGKGGLRKGKYLDGEIVVINEKEIIMKIYQGWFLLNREEAE